MSDTFHPPAEIRLAVIGLGYVGLPLVVEFARHLPTVGFDIKSSRVEALKARYDAAREVKPAELASAGYLHLTNRKANIRNCHISKFRAICSSV